MLGEGEVGGDEEQEEEEGSLRLIEKGGYNSLTSKLKKGEFLNITCFLRSRDNLNI